MKGFLFTTVFIISIYGTSAQIDGNWGDWLAWSPCSVTCLNGETTRTRACDNPPPSNGGLDCVGNATDSLTCIVMNYCLPSDIGNQDLNCGIGYFGCATGIQTCLNISVRCDDTVDCEDGSDENPSFTGCPEKYCSAAYRFTSSSVTLVLLMFAAVQLMDPGKWIKGN